MEKTVENILMFWPEHIIITFKLSYYGQTYMMSKSKIPQQIMDCYIQETPWIVDDMIHLELRWCNTARLKELETILKEVTK